MNKAVEFTLKLAISIIIPLIIVTGGGIFIYSSAGGFFTTISDGQNSSLNKPSTMFFSITIIVSLLFFSIKLKIKYIDLITILIGALFFSLILHHYTTYDEKSLLSFYIPIVVFLCLQWAVLRFQFLSGLVRQIRILIYSFLSGLDFAFSFWIQYKLLRLPIEKDFFRDRFISGLMLFICLGLGLSFAEYFIYKINPPIHNSNEENDD